MRIKGYNIPGRLLYMKEHVWLSIEKSGLVRIGITDYAQKALREITFVYLPKMRLQVRRMSVVATVESVKALSEIYSPVSGEVVEINKELASMPRLINQDPYGEGWIVLIRPRDVERESNNFLKTRQYAEYVKELTKIDKDLLVYRWKRKRKSP
ncbi:MAG: glycine cleavage system protein GcvH [Candidatus Bathyarchaeota archaeon]|nr:MAG: glycine cleavage system protein GcvH [Candidatus Bathyarchaeota archaeon]